MGSGEGGIEAEDDVVVVERDKEGRDISSGLRLNGLRRGIVKYVMCSLWIVPIEGWRCSS